MASFETVDISLACNAGTTNIETDLGYVWPYGGDDPQKNVLARLPKGDELFWGVPFKLSAFEGWNASSTFVEVRRGGDLSRSIGIGKKAKRLLVAHICAPVDCAGITIEGAGEQLGTGRVTLENGAVHEFPLRRRFEIHDVSVPWGHHPFLCRNCREFTSVALDDKTIPWGRAQVGTEKASNDTDGWWIFDWVNPEPDVEITSLTYEASTVTPILIGGVTLSHENDDPLAWPPREEVAVTVDGDSESSMKVEVERGVLARQDNLFIPKDDFLETEETGWGVGGQEVREDGYLEIHGSHEGTIRVSVGEDRKASFRWGDLLAEKSVSDGPVHVEMVSPQGKQWLHVHVTDADTGEQVGCRVHFRSPQGAYFAPHGHQADVNIAWFEDLGGDCKVRGTPYAYIDGKCQIELPIGPVYVEVVRGFEYTPIRELVHIKPGQRDLSLKIGRAMDMKTRGYYSGDTHVHFLTAQSSHLEAAAEDLNVTNLLVSQWGRLFTSWEEFTGGLAPTSSEDYKIWVSQENRQHVLGHISLLGLKDMVAPICTGGPQEDWIGGEIQVLMADWAEECRRQGGLVIMPHMPVPDFENAANITMGHADAVEMCWVWQGEQIGQGERGYYRWLNAGNKLPIVGGTDKMSNGRVLGGSRTYAKLKPGEAFTFESWSQAVRGGNTFASTGAMIDLSIDGEAMGQEVHLPGNGGTVEVVATAESIWPLTAVELIVNGERSARETADGDRRQITVRFEMDVSKPCWVCARTWGEYATDAGPVMAHSSPIYVTVGGKRPFVDADGEYLMTHMEGGIAWAEKIGVFRNEDVRSRLIALFNEARAEIRRRAT
ncbi:MAG: hypothetical protein CME21_17475 [Gemmatimonadetes bacterium]|jgi:hypothetical protein|nr:hypothetical protein [Gemmatimonadota bacterium]